MILPGMLLLLYAVQVFTLLFIVLKTFFSLLQLGGLGFE